MDKACTKIKISLMLNIFTKFYIPKFPLCLISLFKASYNEGIRNYTQKSTDPYSAIEKLIIKFYATFFEISLNSFS